MGAVAHGWLSSKGLGWSTPESFWRVCCHGRRWVGNLQDTMKEIAKSSDKQFSHFDDTLRHALNDRRPEFCLAFLTMYVDHPFPGYNNEQHGYETYQDEHVSFCCFLILKSRTERVIMVDRILFDNDTTLLQRSIIDGDRRMFQILGYLEASLMRPWSEVEPRAHKKGRDTTIWTTGTRKYLNCYSLLALHSKDIWFA